MAVAQARTMYTATGHKAVFGGPPRSELYWSEVFENIPYVARPNEGGKAVMVRNRPGNRPYILGIWENRLIFNPLHRAIPGEMVFSQAEANWLDSLGLPDKFAVVEPHVKGKISGRNKDWGWHNWRRFTQLYEDMPLVQLGPPGTKELGGVEYIETPTFRHAAAVVSVADHFFGTDGGLHHVAGASGTDATVVWGGFSPPEVLGYSFHRNLGGGWCGALDDCDHCRKEMDKIKPHMLL